MKAILAFIAMASCVLTAHGAELIVPASSIGMVVTNDVFTSNSVASVTFTNQQPTLFMLNHTFTGNYVASGTNSTTVTLQRTIEGTTWIPVATNTFTASGNFEYTATGKWTAYRAIVVSLSTNSILSLDYAGE